MRYSLVAPYPFARPVAAMHMERSWRSIFAVSGSHKKGEAVSG